MSLLASEYKFSEVRKIFRYRHEQIYSLDRECQDICF